MNKDKEGGDCAFYYGCGKYVGHEVSHGQLLRHAFDVREGTLRSTHVI